MLAPRISERVQRLREFGFLGVIRRDLGTRNPRRNWNSFVLVWHFMARPSAGEIRTRHGGFPISQVLTGPRRIQFVITSAVLKMTHRFPEKGKRPTQKRVLPIPEMENSRQADGDFCVSGNPFVRGPSHENHSPDSFSLGLVCACPFRFSRRF